LINASFLPLAIDFDQPPYSTTQLSVVCYIANCCDHKKLAIDKNLVRQTLQKLSARNMDVKIVTNEGGSNDRSLDEFLAQAKNYLVDVFISVEDLQVFEENVNSKVKILMTNALFENGEQAKLKELIQQFRIDNILLSTNLNRNVLIQDLNVPESDIDFFDNANANLADWLFRYLQNAVCDMTMCHAEQLYFNDDPIKALNLLNDSLQKIPGQEELLAKKDQIEQLYPQLANDSEYRRIFEEQNSCVKSSPQQLWLKKQLANFSPDTKVLVVGCGSGDIAIELAEKGFIVCGIDISQSKITVAETKYAKEKNLQHQLDFVCGETQQLSQFLPFHQFDVILMGNLLQKVPETDTVLRELAHVIKPNGSLFTTVMLYPYESLRDEILQLQSTRYYLRAFSKTELEQLFSSFSQITIEEFSENEDKWYGITVQTPSGLSKFNKEKLEQNLEPMLHEAVANIHNNDLKSAFSIFLNMLKIDPNQPQILYNAAVIGDQLGERETAIRVLEQVIQLKPSMPEPYFYLGKIFYQNQEFDKALSLFKSAIAQDVNHDDYYRHYKLAADKLGISLVDESTDIVFYTAGLKFNGNSDNQRGIGGSENALSHLATELSRSGKQVRVFNNCDNPGKYDQVLYGDLTDFYIYRYFNKIKTFISLRSLKPFKVNLQADLKILWIQDNCYVDFLQSEHIDQLGIDKIFAVSYWQCENWKQYFQLTDDQFYITRNGVDLSLFRPGKQRRNPFKLVFLSRPERGLELMLTLFREIRKKIPEAELFIYSYQFEEQSELMRQYADKARQPGVILRGSLSRKELARELQSARLMVYPTTHLETSCMAAIEALAAGVPVISSQLGAIPETVNHGETGILVPGEPNSNDFNQAFVKAVIDLLTDDEKWQRLSKNARQRAKRFYSWKKIATEWQGEIDRLISVKHGFLDKKIKFVR